MNFKAFQKILTHSQVENHLMQFVTDIFSYLSLTKTTMADSEILEIRKIGPKEIK